MFSVRNLLVVLHALAMDWAFEGGVSGGSLAEAATAAAAAAEDATAGCFAHPLAANMAV